MGARKDKQGDAVLNREPDREWTIYDIAREAGVSAKTVSRVLNQKDGVSKATRERILSIMRAVDYHANIGARTLRGKMQGCIGLTVAAPLSEVPVSQGLFLWLFDELYRTFGIRGEYLCFDLNPYFGGMATDYARGIWEKLYKACIVVGPLPYNDTAIHRVHRSGIPYVAFGRLDSLPECSCATVDYEEGVRVSTRFLIARGHRRIAMLRALAGFQPGVERFRGYAKALEEAGIPVDERLVRSATFGARSIADEVYRLLADPRVTALIDCSATEDATALREGARRAGRVPGKDFEIVAWTYADNAAVLREASAHVWLPVREAASEGIERLAAWIRGEDPGPFQIVRRPVLHEMVENGEVPKPKRLFELLA